MTRFSWGWRQRLPLIPGVLWLNFSRSGISLSVHEGLATWNSRRGFRLRGPFGTYLQERRRRR